MDVAAAAGAGGGADASPEAAGPPPLVNDLPPQTPILPVVWIEVAGKGIPYGSKISGKLKIITGHEATNANIAAAPAALESVIGISLRGSTSKLFPQKSYSIELRDEAGAERKMPVLGLPKDADWALIGCWLDRPCMRNPLEYTISRALGHWAPRTRFVEVYLDGQYNGIYLLTESIRAGKNRVPIPKPAATAADGDLTGGYIWRLEGRGKGGARDWTSPATGTVYTYHFPGEQIITSAQKAFMQDHVAKFETLMKSAGWADAELGYSSWIDEPGWIDYAIMQALSTNVDGYWKSLYFTKFPDLDGKRGLIQMLPIWDFNIAFGNKAPEDGRPAAEQGVQGFIYRKERGDDYWARLWAHRPFQNAVKCRWQDLRRALVTPASVRTLTDEWTATLLPNAVPRHFAKFPSLKDGSVLPAAEFFKQQVDKLVDWAGARADWLDTHLPGTCPR